MTARNQQIVDDVQAIRDEIELPDARRYTLKVKPGHVRVVFDDDVELVSSDWGGAAAIRELQERGYTFVGLNFRSKMIAFAPDGGKD